MVHVLFIVFCIILFVYLFIKLELRSKLPPNTRLLPSKCGIPCLGIILTMKQPLHHYLYELSKKIGPIYTITLGIRSIVIVNDIVWFKKCFKEHADVFSGRWMSFLFKYVAHDSGIIMKDGKVWANSRSFILKVLRDFGVGKARSVDIVKYECNLILQDLKRSNEGVVDLEELIPFYTLNIISKFIMNRHYNQNNPDIILIKKVLNDITQCPNKSEIIDLMYPCLKYFSLFRKLSIYLFKDYDNFINIHEIFHKEIEYHKENLNQKSEPEDLMDRFIIEQQKYKENQEPAEFKSWQLIRMCFELFSAGYETTSTTLIWTMFFLSYHSNIQEKVYKEIEEIIGNERKPEMNDKKDLHYTQAVMDECLRLSSVAPLAIFHRTIKGCIIDNFYISNNTVVMPNIYGCHRDSSVWEKPFEFYPEHFLTADRKYRAREELVAFGIGKRQCLGENLARIEYFLFLIRIIQTFRVELANLITQEEFDDCMLSTDSIIRGSKIKDFRFIRRK